MEDMSMSARRVEKIQKTIRLPKSLLDERKQLDSKFSEISKDTDYQRDAQLMAEEFEGSDWETAKLLDE
jgi:hypothetical protein